jgi:hypothetical protein
MKELYTLDSTRYLMQNGTSLFLGTLDPNDSVKQLEVEIPLASGMSLIGATQGAPGTFYYLIDHEKTSDQV